MSTTLCRPVIFVIESATGFLARLRGVGRDPDWTQYAVLFLPRCRAVHTMALRQPIDVIFATSSGRILAIKHSLRPWRIAVYSGDFGSRQKLLSVDAWELPAGRCRELGIREGDPLVDIFKRSV